MGEEGSLEGPQQGHRQRFCLLLEGAGHAAERGILRGVTRTVLFEAIKALRLAIEERAFTLAEAYAAREAFITSASQIVMPVVAVDGRAIGDGRPGPVAVALRRAYHDFAEAG